MSLYTIDNTEQFNDNLLSYPRHNHYHCSDVVCWRGGDHQIDELHRRYAYTINPIMRTGNYNATSNNMKLVH